jgi:hypothetical protein
MGGFYQLSAAKKIDTSVEYYLCGNVNMIALKLFGPHINISIKHEA